MLKNTKTKNMSKIRTLRKRQGMTLEDLSEATGISVSYLSRIEAGSRRLNSDTLSRISSALGCHPADLLDDFIPRRDDVFRERHSYTGGHGYSWSGGHNDANVDQMLAQFYPMIASLNNEARSALLRHALTLSIAQIGQQNGVTDVLRVGEGANDSFNQTTTSPLSVLQELPVYRQSQNNEGATIDFTRPLRWVARPSELVGVPTAFALEITDHSLAPKYRPGDLILVNPNRTVSPGCSSIVLKKDQKVLVREYVQTLGDKVILREVTATSSDNPTAQIEISNSDLQSMYRIIGTIENAA